MRKKLIPCIYIKNGMAINKFSDETIIETNPVRLAKKYSDAVCDEILVFDLSNEDSEHEEAINIIRDICENVKVGVIAAGNVKRMEDVKKLLYAGCKKAVLNYSREDNIELTREVSMKFGRDRIAVCIGEKIEYTDNRDLIENYVKDVLFLDEKALREADEEEKISNPVIVMLPEVSLNRMITFFGKFENIGITGETINENTDQYEAIRKLVGIENVPFSIFKLGPDGLVPVVVQDYKTNAVLMVAYMNREAYEKTLATRVMTYWSRSRQEIWVKGLTSGHFQYVKSLAYDCDADTLLAKVEQVGAACHTGSYSCFFNEIISDEYDTKDPFSIMSEIYRVVEDRKVNPKEGSYTNYLFDKGLDKILKKVGEEATEIVVAAKNPDINELRYEISDFLYHVMVLMVEKGLTWEEVMSELANR